MLGTSEPSNARDHAKISAKAETSAGITSKADAKIGRNSATKRGKIGSNIAKIFGITALIVPRKFGIMREISTMTSSTTPGGVLGVGEPGGPGSILRTRGGGGAARVGIPLAPLSQFPRSQVTPIM